MSTSFPQIDKSKYYTKTETHALLDALAMGEYEFANAYYNKDYVDGLLDLYYDKATVDQILADFEGGSAEYPDMTGNAGKFLSNDGTNAIWDNIPSPTFVGLSELPQYKLDTEVLTSERWVDGKPIYQKVINFGALPNNTTKAVAHLSVDVEEIWLDRANSFILDSTGGKYGLELASNMVTDNWFGSVNTTSVYMRTHSNRTSYTGSITIKYTKTTDTDNSPVALVGSQYNISSTEYVLPYTRNGKTVYGMEVDFGALPNITKKKQ